MKKITVIGSGNWGTAIACLIGQNVLLFPNMFHELIHMWVNEEIFHGRKLSELINEEHENVKYLPGKHIPKNVKAVPDIIEASKDADILIFVLPHQYIESSLKGLKGQLKKNAFGISLVKGFSIPPSGGLQLVSSLIKNLLGINVSVLMGANLAPEVANGHFCETTIGCTDPQESLLLKCLFNSPNFKVVTVEDAVTVEVCGALKNIVACGAGFIDGLRLGDNSKAAVIRLGLMEMISFTKDFYDSPHYNSSTFFESCGIADLVTTCYGGRNRRICEAFVSSGKGISELEAEMLQGQKLQGPETASEVYRMLLESGSETKFPLFRIIHLICNGDAAPKDIIEALQTHPEHMK